MDTLDELKEARAAVVEKIEFLMECIKEVNSRYTKADDVFDTDMFKRVKLNQEADELTLELYYADIEFHKLDSLIWHMVGGELTEVI